MGKVRLLVMLHERKVLFRMSKKPCTPIAECIILLLLLFFNGFHPSFFYLFQSVSCPLSIHEAAISVLIVLSHSPRSTSKIGVKSLH